MRTQGPPYARVTRWSRLRGSAPAAPGSSSPHHKVERGITLGPAQVPEA